MPGELRVVATAGHVDHGKSSLIVRLTGIDPDRWAEEKRRGLTIDLGYAWCTLPSGREIGFVDVPGHERFVRNMLAGVGPVRTVMFVVAADEGWKPQSEEHLQILDVLGAEGGVVALTKRDLVDDETLEIAHEEVRERVEGTALQGAPIVAVSAQTGEGIEELADALDTMLASTPSPEDTRTRLFVDRVFTIKGAGTVVTGTLTGGCLELGDDVEISASGQVARIRSLQTHRESEDRACPVSRVAANLVGADRDRMARGDVLTSPHAWRSTTVFDAELRTVRDLPKAITSRGAFMVHAGAAETAARVRFLDGSRLEPGATTMVRIRTAHPLVLDVFERFVLRDEGRGATVGGGVILDVAPPRRGGPRRVDDLVRRAAAERAELPGLVIEELGAVPADDVAVLVGAPAPADLVVDGWAVDPAIREIAATSAEEFLSAFHRDHPLEEGAPRDDVRRSVTATLRATGVQTKPGLIDALLEAGAHSGTLARTASTFRLAEHRVALDEHADQLAALVAAVSGDHEATPPTIAELIAAGFPREMIKAAARNGTVIRVSTDLVVSPGFVEKAEAAIAAGRDQGTSVSGLREALGTSRKYAVPLVEWLDREGRTVRRGDLRYPKA